MRVVNIKPHVVVQYVRKEDWPVKTMQKEEETKIPHSTKHQVKEKEETLSFVSLSLSPPLSLSAVNYKKYALSIFNFIFLLFSHRVYLDQAN